MGADAGARCSALRDAPPTAPLLRTRWAVGRCGRLALGEAAAAAAAIPGAESTFSRRCGGFSGRAELPTLSCPRTRASRAASAAIGDRVRARAKALDPRFRGEDRKGASSFRASRRMIQWAAALVRAGASFDKLRKRAECASLGFPGRPRLPGRAAARPRGRASLIIASFCNARIALTPRHARLRRRQPHCGPAHGACWTLFVFWIQNSRDCLRCTRFVLTRLVLVKNRSRGVGPNGSLHHVDPQAAAQAETSGSAAYCPRRGANSKFAAKML